MSSIAHLHHNNQEPFPRPMQLWLKHCKSSCFILIVNLMIQSAFNFAHGTADGLSCHAECNICIWTVRAAELIHYIVDICYNAVHYSTTSYTPDTASNDEGISQITLGTALRESYSSPWPAAKEWYTPRNMHVVHALFCFVDVMCWSISPALGLLLIWFNFNPSMDE